MSLTKTCFFLLAGTSLSIGAFAQSAASACLFNPAAPFGTSNSLVRVITLQTDLSTSNVNPPVTDRTASGMATFTIRLERTSANSQMPTRALVTSNLQFTGGQAETITSGSIAAGVVGTNGTPILSIDSPTPVEVAPGQTITIERQTTITDMATLNGLGAILANPSAYYVTVNSSSATSGLVRGQLALSAEDSQACANDTLSILRRLVTLLAAQQNLISAAERDALLGVTDQQIQ